MITKDKINFVVGVNEEAGNVTIKFCNNEIHEIPIGKAMELVSMGQLYGHIDHKFIPCLKFGNEYFPEYYPTDDKIYRADSPSIYNEMNNRISGETKLYTIQDMYVIYYKGHRFVVKSHIAAAGFVMNDVKEIKLADGRMYIAAQGLSSFNYGVLQAVYNELMFLTDEGVYCLYHSNKKRMEELAKYYKPVDMSSSKIADIKQKIINSNISAEINRFDVTCRENVIFIGNLEINLGNV